MCWRVAWTVAEAERGYGADEAQVLGLARAFYTMMVRGECLPNSPALMNCGTGNGLQYSACYVLPIEDSMESIMGALRDAALIHRTGGGVGYSFTRLRPEGARVRTSGGQSSGPISFMKIYDTMTEHVRQGGRRRGANMGILRVDHPDIRAFIDAKRSGGIVNFNVSVAVTDEFMEALARDEDYPLRAQAGWPRPDGSDYAPGEPYRDPATGRPVRLRARRVWEAICRAAWATGDPGLFFIDRANRSPANPLPEVYRIESTNPCVTGDTLVATPRGWVRADALEVGDMIVTPDGPRPVARVDVSRHPVYRVTFSDGGVVRATAGHQFSARPADEPGVRWRPIRLDHLRLGDRVQVVRTGHPTLPDLTGEAEIVRIDPEGAATVWDLYEPISDTWLPEGYLSRGCGEEPLPPWGVCNLASLNLARCADTLHKQIDWERLGRAAHLAVRFLDNLIDINPFPLPQIRELAQQERRIGLGVMGWADLLIDLRIPYDSDEAVNLARDLGGFLLAEARRASEALARARGAFPLFARSRYAEGPPRRNSTVTTVAPTGSISTIAGCASGIEPLFAVAFTHDPHQAGNRRQLHFLNEGFLDLARARGLLSDRLLEALVRQGTLEGLDVPEDFRRLFKSAHEIPFERHIQHQAAWQRHFSETAISKTVNLPHRATVADIERAYRCAWELGCLGITVFRDGSKREQVLTAGTQGSERPPAPPAMTSPEPLIHPNPPRLHAERFWKDTPLGRVFVNVSQDESSEPFEVFISLGKAGSDVMAFTEALGRVISTFLRYDRLPSRNERAREVIEQLKGIGGAQAIGFGPEKVLSVPDGIAKVLEELLAPPAPPAQLALPDSAAAPPNGPGRLLGDLCPTCGVAAVVREEGCRHCLACGVYSEC